MASISVVQAVLLGFFSFITATGVFPLGWLSMNIMSKPLIHCLIIGLIMGNVADAMIVGCVIQAAYIGQMSIGGVATLPNIGTALWFALPLSLISGADAAITLTICLAFAPINTFANELGNIFKQFILHADDALIERGRIKQAVWFPYLSHISTFITSFVFVTVICLVGQSAIQAFVESIPSWVSGILNVYISLVPAVGFMMLLVTLIHDNLQFIFFIVGFMLCASMGLNTMSITAIGCLVAYVIYLCSKPADAKEGK
ncbi:MAG: PTS sugar transporter subunit IIC [Erysipelotrichaceae bacterium]|jgi:mannose/fructose/N-acetylgalactosamine-specific phosphotransferase system component IIC|nr:PTS sugar transporter subunit IIC [Erysipelotrichaceae bacterium]